MGFPSSWSEYHKWRDRIQHRYNAGAQNGLPSPGGRTKAVAQHDPRPLPRPHASQLGRKTGADIPPFTSSNVNTTGPRLTKAQEDSGPLQRSGHEALGLPGPTLQCPPDCPSKRFCDPSSCALESVREANAIAEALRRTA